MKWIKKMKTLNVRWKAKQQGADLPQLLYILQHRRPAASPTEEAFVDKMLGDIPGMWIDDYGNYFVRVGESNTMWSCHTDTVSKEYGMQNLTWDGDILKLHEGRPGQSLGADDGAGMWLLLEMIKANKPGLYLFHRAEEIGGLGSEYFAKHYTKELKGIERAIAFDRRGTADVITHQRFRRCCSDTFALALAAELNEQNPDFAFKPSDDGIFTDTANYTDDIPECTNISTGYYKEHGPNETLDVAHLLRLREAVLAIDFETLPTERDPTDIEDDWSYYGGWGNITPTTGYSLADVIKTRSHTLARYMSSRGWTARDLEDALDKFVDEEHCEDFDQSFALYCWECMDVVATEMNMNVKMLDGEACPECGFFQTEVVDAAEYVA